MELGRFHLRDSYKTLNFYRYSKSSKTYEVIKAVNTRSRYKKNTLRTMVMIFEKNKLARLKLKRKEDSEFVINSWNGIHW